MNERTFSHLQAAKLDAPERRTWLPVSPVLEQLAPRLGSTVADIGAGTGYFSLPMANAVGESGRIFAVDLQPEMLVLLEAKLTDAHITNVDCRIGEAAFTRLESGSCHLVLMANLWHELDDFPQVLAEVRRILVNNGRVAILDWRPGVEQPPGPPLVQRIPAESVVEDLEIAGFVIVSNHEVGLYSYLITADTGVVATETHGRSSKLNVKSQGSSPANRLQDGVYRAMLRLEADKSNACSQLCRCLLESWLNHESIGQPESGESPPFEIWLKQITPICLELECPAFSVPVRNDKTGSERSL